MASNSLQDRLENLERLQQNVYNFFQAFYEALTTDKEVITATIELADGTTQNVIVPSNIFLKADLDRLRSTVENLTGVSDTLSGSVVSINDGAANNFREIILSTYKKAIDKIENSEVSLNPSVHIEQNSLLDRLVSPSTFVEITLPERFKNSSHVALTKLVVDDLTDYANGEDITTVKQRLASSATPFVEKDEIAKTVSRPTRFYGTFDVFEITDNANDTFTLRLNKNTYSDSNSPVLDSRELDVNDELITKDGFGIYQVTQVVDDTLGIFVTVQHIGGHEGLATGEATLSLNDRINHNKIIRVPIIGQEKSILFISGLDDRTDTRSIHSESILIDTSTYTYTSENNIETPFDTYFASNILAIGQYLESVVQDNTIPRHLAVNPEKPVLVADNFTVRQINKHITNTSNSDRILRFSRDKNKVSSELNTLAEKVSAISNRIQKGQYKSVSEKERDEAQLNRLILDQERKTKLFSSIVTNIKQSAVALEQSKANPKYRVQGFWTIDEPTSSVTGNLQRVVQYNTRYKFVPQNSDYSEPGTINVNGVEAVVSPWTESKSVPLNKSFNAETNSYVWDNVDINDADVNNINQIEVPISYGESVVIQVQAISEAGYPGNPAVSEWSDPIKINFPEELAQDERIASIIEDNEDDLVRVEVDNEFNSRGITRHVQNSFTEQENYFAHIATEIDSGQRTTEQKVISLAEYLKSQDLRIQALEEIVSRRNTKFDVELVAPNGRVYPINHLSSTNVFAGHYTDNVDIYDAGSYGNIIEVEFYLRLINRNATTAEIPSISPGVLIDATSNANYSDVSYGTVGSGNRNQQLNGQLVYTRNVDISGSQALITNNTTTSNTVPPASDIDAAAPAAARDVVQYDGVSFSRLKLTDAASGTDYVLLSTSHPLFAAYAANTSDPANITALEDEFARVAQFNPVNLEDIHTHDYASTTIQQYSDNDKYLVGRNSTGARLFMRVSDITNIQVDSSDASSAKILQNGDSNAIMIPVVYQYRMTDHLGRINGDSNLSVTASNVTYTKTIGIDLNVGNELFKFDLHVSSQFRQTTLSASNQDGNTVINSIDPSSSTTPNIA